MSQPPPQWQWDPRSRRWYMHDVQHQLYIFEDGVRVSAVPRGQPSASQQSASAADLSTSPTGRHAAYGISHGSAPTTTHPGVPSSAPPSRSTTSGSARRESTVSPDPLVQDFAPMTLRDNPRPRAANEERKFTDPQGRQYLEVRDPGNQVRTTIQIGPANSIPTDPELLQQGIRATQMLIGTSGDTEQLFEGFRRRGSPRRFFTLGKVFRVLWSEPAGDTRTLVTFEPGISTARFGERVHSKVRLFVVIREGDTYCSALSIVSYSYQGVAKRGVKKSEHGIVHSGKTAPEPSEAEAPQRGEEPMRSDPIRINPDDQADPLHAMSRIDYAKVYTIQHNIKVKSYGAVHPSSIAALRHQFINVWLGEDHARALAGSSSLQSGSRAPEAASSSSRRPGRRESHSISTTTASDAEAAAGAAGPSTTREAQARAAVKRPVREGRTEAEAREIVRATARQQQQESSEDSGGDSGGDSDAESDASGSDASADARVPGRSSRSTEQRSNHSSRDNGRSQKVQHPPRIDSRSHRQAEAGMSSSRTAAASTNPAIVASGSQGQERSQSQPRVQASSSSRSTAQVQQASSSSRSTAQGPQAAPARSQGQAQASSNPAVQAAVQKLMDKGYTQEQAMQYVAQSMARQR